MFSLFCIESVTIYLVHEANFGGSKMKIYSVTAILCLSVVLVSCFAPSVYAISLHKHWPVGGRTRFYEFKVSLPLSLSNTHILQLYSSNSLMVGVDSWHVSLFFLLFSWMFQLGEYYEGDKAMQYKRYCYC
jgi:hypothetical protein